MSTLSPSSMRVEEEEEEEEPALTDEELEAPAAAGAEPAAWWVEEANIGAADAEATRGGSACPCFLCFCFPA